jgi:hypothetical protein
VVTAVIARRTLERLRITACVAKPNDGGAASALIYSASRIPTPSGGRFRVLTVRGYEPARLAGEHHNAAAAFVRTSDISLIESFKGQSVQATNGRRYPLETDPNTLHRIAAMDTPPFHEIYEIISST